jgi:photosystem II stability/assembly factor-like uncharacterized protein
MFLGSARGGVWKTVDGGESWAPLTDDQPSLAISAIAIDPNAPDTVYASTGDRAFIHFPLDSLTGRASGLLKSTDGGRSWTRMAPETFVGQVVTRIVVHGPSGTVFASSSPEPTNQGPPLTSDAGGLYRSSDNGLTWKRLSRSGITDFALEPGSAPKRALLAETAQVGILDFETGAVQSVANTGGDMAVDWAPSDANVLYAGLGSLVKRSLDGGATWSDVGGGFDYGANAYDNVVRIHPLDANVVYFGGSFEHPLMRLTGATTAQPTWEDVAALSSSILNRPLHADVHAIDFAPHNADTILVGSDGGIARSHDAGRSWEKRNGGLAIAQLHDFCVDASNSLSLGGAFQDNGVGMTDLATPSSDWSLLPETGGDGIACLRMTLDSGERRVLAETQFGVVSYLDPASQAWVASFDGSAACPSPIAGCGEHIGFAVPLIQDPSDPTTVYLGTQRIWRSGDGGKPSSWGPTSGDLGLESNDVIASIAISRANTSRFYIVSAAGILSTTGDAGASWTRMKLPRDRAAVAALVADDTESSVVYVAFETTDCTTDTQACLFRSSDSGASWSPLVVPLLAGESLHALALHSDRRDGLYVGTDAGVLGSNDAGRTWQPVASGLPMVAVKKLLFHRKDRALLAATYGRSVWRILQ